MPPRVIVNAFAGVVRGGARCTDTCTVMLCETGNVGVELNDDLGRAIRAARSEAAECDVSAPHGSERANRGAGVASQGSTRPEV